MHQFKTCSIQEALAGVSNTIRVQNELKNIDTEVWSTFECRTKILCSPRDCASFKIRPDFGSSANIFKIMIFCFPLVRNSCVMLLNYIRKRVKDVLGAVRAPQMNFLNCPFSLLCKKWSITVIIK